MTCSINKYCILSVSVTILAQILTCEVRFQALPRKFAPVACQSKFASADKFERQQHEVRFRSNKFACSRHGFGEDRREQGQPEAPKHPYWHPCRLCDGCKYPRMQKRFKEVLEAALQHRGVSTCDDHRCAVQSLLSFDSSPAASRRSSRRLVRPTPPASRGGS